MAIYKKKMNEPNDGSELWDKLLLLSGSFIPFVALTYISPVWFSGEENVFNQNWNNVANMMVWDNLTILFIIVAAIFGVFFDSKHIFSTYSRTYLDKSFYRQNKKWLFMWYRHVPDGERPPKSIDAENDNIADPIIFLALHT